MPGGASKAPRHLGSFSRKTDNTFTRIISKALHDLCVTISSSSPSPSAQPYLSLLHTRCRHNPANHSFLSLLEGCRSIEEFKQIHSHIIRAGLPLTPAKRRSMLSFCCSSQSGDMDYARALFDQMPALDVFLWNAMIRGYSNQNSPLSAVSLYIRMISQGLRPNNYTFPFLLKSFDRAAAFACGDELHAHVLKFGLGSNAFVQNALIHMYALSGEADAARQVFATSPKQDVMWNAMISGYNRGKRFHEACELFREMERENVKPNSVTIVSVLSACAKSKDFNLGTRVHRIVVDSNLIPNLGIENALIDMYAACGDMNAAWSLFENMKARDVISWTAMVVGFANSREITRARLVFNQMPEKDFISWTAMINGYVQAGHFQEALEIFRQMQTAKIDPDEVTMVSLLTACSQLGALEVGEWIKLYMERNNIVMDIFVGNALVDMYSKCGAVERAAGIFEKMRRRDKFTWTAMITGLAVNGRGEEAVNVFYQMLGTCTRPDEVTFIGVLTACAHAGLVEKGRELFTSMITAHGIVPSVSHYACLIDLLGRAGQLEEALETITNMPRKPNSTVWASLLGACRIHRNVEMAELAAKRLLELEPENSAVYVLLSNIYMKCNKWEEVSKVRKMMMEWGIKKVPGCSLIEMNGAVHEFVAGARSHPRTGDIYSKLEEMGRELKLAGYVPDVSKALLDMNEEVRDNAVYQHRERLAIAFGLIS